MPDDTPGQGPHYLRPSGVDLFPGGQGPTGAGGVLSVVTLDVGDANAVVAELIPLQPGSASYTILDSKDKGAGFSAVLDAGYSPGTSQAATTKAAINGPRRYVRALLVVSSGIWTITATPVYQPSNANVTASITGTVAANQGTANAGGAAAWPVQAADGALVTEGALADTAWGGTGSGSIVAILKALWARLRGGQAAMAASLPVAIASDQSAVPISGTVTSANPTAGTAAQSSVAGSATSVTLLAANAARLGATFYNDSAATLYLRLGSAAASTTSYTVQLAANGYYELPFGWTGAVTGIWASATGSARISELSA